MPYPCCEWDRPATQRPAGYQKAESWWSGPWDSSSVSMGRIASRSRDWQDGKRAHSLRAVDEDTFDVRRRGWAGVETGIVPVAKLRPAIGMVQIDDNVGGIEQHDQVLREVGDRVDAEVGIAQEDRASLRDGERRAHDGEVHIRQIP